MSGIGRGARRWAVLPVATVAVLLGLMTAGAVASVLPPPDAYDPATGPRLVPKPVPTPSATPVPPWRELELTASPKRPSPGQYTRLTARTNQDLGATPLWITIEDVAGTVLARCGAGTTCRVSVARQSAGTYDYAAHLSSGQGAGVPTSRGSDGPTWGAGWLSCRRGGPWHATPLEQHLSRRPGTGCESGRMPVLEPNPQNGQRKMLLVFGSFLATS